MSDIKFLTTNDILAGIERIIGESKKYLYIISPYLQIEGNIKRRLEDESALKGVDVHLVYRKDKEDETKRKKYYNRRERLRQRRKSGLPRCLELKRTFWKVYTPSAISTKKKPW